MMAENIADIVSNLFGNEDSSEYEAANDLPYIGLQIMRDFDEGIEEITIDEPATNNFLPEERQTDSSSFIVIVDDADEPQDVLGTHTSAATSAAKFSLSLPVNAGGVANEAQPSILSAEDGKNDKSQSLSTNNLMATRISDEEKSFYKEMFKDPSAICKMRLHCTACDRHLGLSTKTVVFSHRIMRVLLCQRCYLFYDTGEFQQGDDGSDMFCRWCGQGGRLICCSLCSNVFCEKCISRNFGTTQLRRIKKADDWFCFVCNLKSLWPARATCAELKKAVAELKRKSAEVKAREGKAPPCVDLSKCCSSETPKVKTVKAKETVVAEEQKKPLAMIQPLPKKKVLSPPGTAREVNTVSNHQGYVTVSSREALRESPSLRGQPSLLWSQLKTLQQTKTTPTFSCTKTYQRTPQRSGLLPVRFPSSVGGTQYYTMAHATPGSQAKVTGATTSTPQSDLRHRFMKIVSTPHTKPTLPTPPQKHSVSIQPRQAPRQQPPGTGPSYQAVEPTLNFPNTRLLAPNQVYSIPSAYIKSVVKNRPTLSQIPGQVLRPVANLPSPPSSKQDSCIENFPEPQHSNDVVDQKKVKTKWFVCGFEKFAGVSSVLWSHIHKLKESFASLEAKNDVQGMKAAAGELHHLLEEAAANMKDIDKMVGKEFRDWCKSLKTLPKQSNGALLEVIDITNDEDCPKPAEVVEMEITPDIISLGPFSGSTGDLQYGGEGPNTCASPPRKNRRNSNLSSPLSASPNNGQMTNQAVVSNLCSTVLDHAYSVAEPAGTASKASEESDVTLDLDICCESDEDDHDIDGTSTGESQVINCEEDNFREAIEYDNDNSLKDKLSEVMNSKQVSLVSVGDGMCLDEITGEVAPDYESSLKSISKADSISVLKMNLGKGNTVMTQTDSADVVSSHASKEKIAFRICADEQKGPPDIPKTSSVTVQTETTFGEIALEESKYIELKRDIVQTSENLVKPWSNEFDSFLKKMDVCSEDVPSSSSGTVTVPTSPISKPSDSDERLPRQLTDTPEKVNPSENLPRLKEAVEKTVLQKCKVILDKAKLSGDLSVASNTLASPRVKIKKEKLDFVYTDSAVSKVLQSRRRMFSNVSQNLPAPESIKRKRHLNNSSDFENVAKKFKSEVDIKTKYPEVTSKLCIVKVERLK